jgi:hypothetical protein
LVWNAAMMVEIAIAFSPDVAYRGPSAEADTRFGPCVRVLFWAAVVLPLGERAGWLDAWPAHALYASHVERASIWLQPTDPLDEIPAPLRRFVSATGVLDQTAWSRAIRGVPIYPSSRASTGLAEALAARYGDRLTIGVSRVRYDDWWTGRRTFFVSNYGLEAIRRQGDRYWLNAHPAGEFLRSPR